MKEFFAKLFARSRPESAKKVSPSTMTSVPPGLSLEALIYRGNLVDG